MYLYFAAGICMINSLLRYYLSIVLTFGKYLSLSNAPFFFYQIVCVYKRLSINVMKRKAVYITFLFELYFIIPDLDDFEACS